MAEETTFTLTIKGGETPRQYTLKPGITTVGRQVGNDVHLDDSRVSRQHANFACTTEGCDLTDLGSSNGTLVNGNKLSAQVPVSLKSGDVIEMGSFTLVYETQVMQSEAPQPALVIEPEPVEPPLAEEISDVIAEPERVEEIQMGAEDMPALPPSPPKPKSPAQDSMIPPGLGYHSQRLMQYLPGIYHTDFMSRFLAMFEATLVPIEWTIDNFDVFLDPGSAPSDFLRWLAGWFDITFDDTWSEAQRRTLLKEAHAIYARRGTPWALARVLEIYTGTLPVIDDLSKDLEPYTFRVRLHNKQAAKNKDLIERLINVHKPAHTQYTLDFKT